MPTYAELIAVLKTNEIRKYSHCTKSKLIDLLITIGLKPVRYGTNKREKAKNDIDPKYHLVRQIRSNAKKAEIYDLETDKVVLYPSIYKAACMMEKYGGTGMQSK